ncbi:ABC transporter permease [Micropruina sonneratiae]|uniref:ABC transporter permease n=1 Tax=Micropruina sonneratiae TaxID=2986940 RepID=UPI00222620DB|nr:ABC transporter permease [Micropruina sp. KQZ13P-5]
MRRLNPRHRRVIAPMLLGVVLLGLWSLAAAVASPVLLPGPARVLARLWTDATAGTLWPYLAVTLAEALGGCLLGAVVALPLAVAIHRSAWFSDAVQPFLGATQAIPAIALAPLLVLWIGYGLVPVVLLCALIVFFPILVAAVVGLRMAPRELSDAARLDGAGSLALLRHIEAPLALPSLLGGFKNGFALSVTGAVVGEMVMGGAGLGTVLTVQRDAVDTTGMFATIAWLCLIAAGAYSLITWWERRSAIVESLT